MEMIPITGSSAINAIGYENGTLAIEFHQRKIYFYPNVPEQLFKDFLTAPSHGKFFDNYIRDKYFPLT